MNRKLIILAVSAILVFVAIAAGLVALLYAGTGKKGSSEIVNQQGYELLDTFFDGAKRDRACFRRTSSQPLTSIARKVSSHGHL